MAIKLVDTGKFSDEASEHMMEVHGLVGKNFYRAIMTRKPVTFEVTWDFSDKNLPEDVYEDDDPLTGE